MTYFDTTLEIDPIEEQDSTPVLPEERHVFELVGFEKSAPDQFRKEGGVKWTWRVFKEDGRTPFVFGDEQYLFFRTTGLTRNGKPNFNVGTYANEWASAMLGRSLDKDSHFQIPELYGARMSAMVVWESQKADPKKKTIKLASLRHVPKTTPTNGVASNGAAPAVGVSASPTNDEIDRATIMADLASAVKTAKKLRVASYPTFKEALDNAGQASVDQLRAILANVKAENDKALDADDDD